jgi:hypothetical protein
LTQDPVPAFPLNVIPYLFILTVAAALGWFFVLTGVVPR